jgi:hypothetical protein
MLYPGLVTEPMSCRYVVIRHAKDEQPCARSIISIERQSAGRYSINA